MSNENAEKVRVQIADTLALMGATVHTHHGVFSDICWGNQQRACLRINERYEDGRIVIGVTSSSQFKETKLKQSEKEFLGDFIERALADILARIGKSFLNDVKFKRLIQTEKDNAEATETPLEPSVV